MAIPETVRDITMWRLVICPIGRRQTDVRMLLVFCGCKGALYNVIHILDGRDRGA